MGGREKGKSSLIKRKINPKEGGTGSPSSRTYSLLTLSTSYSTPQVGDRMWGAVKRRLGHWVAIFLAPSASKVTRLQATMQPGANMDQPLQGPPELFVCPLHNLVVAGSAHTHHLKVHFHQAGAQSQI